MSSETVARFVSYVQALGRGPGRSRPLTRAEAADALGLMLEDGAVDPHQAGAFLMLLRYRGEDGDELAGLVDAARLAIAAAPPPGRPVDLDWPSYGAGRTREAPWFLLAAVALAAGGLRIAMHGSNEFSTGFSVADGLAALDHPAAASRADANAQLDASGFAYLPLAALSPGLDRLLGLRRLFGLRSPVNTLVRLLDPFDALAGIDGVFHPPYIDRHIAAAVRLGRPRLLVMKGGGGEAERNPAKPMVARLHRRDADPLEIVLPALIERPDGAPKPLGLDGFRAVWRGEAAPLGATETIVGTMALALVAAGRAEPVDADEMARDLWRARPIR
ncbi:MAG TPA: glycosyl transferase family protein [Aliidongia sp.]|uniref:glycosyl transferase family protein n=1 Tax=Aliidongia sp. TaxID=1914230 RepID=UPI002DDD5B85|nr:glycosyl transferase family protein [Aliidongia sp.]HEV2675817.1 glycosyl transferase family protein [Aliidongia sp.]